MYDCLCTPPKVILYIFSNGITNFCSYFLNDLNSSFEISWFSSRPSVYNRIIFKILGSRRKCEKASSRFLNLIRLWLAPYWHYWSVDSFGIHSLYSSVVCQELFESVLDYVLSIALGTIVARKRNKTHSLAIKELTA